MLRQASLKCKDQILPSDLSVRNFHETKQRCSKEITVADAKPHNFLEPRIFFVTACTFLILYEFIIRRKFDNNAASTTNVIIKEDHDLLSFVSYWKLTVVLLPASSVSVKRVCKFPLFNVSTIYFENRENVHLAKVILNTTEWYSSNQSSIHHRFMLCTTV